MSNRCSGVGRSTLTGMPEVIGYWDRRACYRLHAPHSLVIASDYWFEHYEGYQRNILNMILIYGREARHS